MWYKTPQAEEGTEPIFLLSDMTCRVKQERDTVLVLFCCGFFLNQYISFY